MPFYIFQNPETQEVIEIMQSMKSEHTYVDEKGIKWDRIFTVPNAAMDSGGVDPYSKEDFLKATDKRGITCGEMFDLSAEMSSKRESKDGKDSIKEKAQIDYKKKTGKAHPEAIKKRKNRTIEI
tara:strand:- start:165 stop:536 length:372 start_codon:yes stop_codon:yes gene_type:complete